MGQQDASSSRKTYVVDTSILVAAPDSVSHLTPDNTVVIPFPVLQELDRRRTAANGVGYTARNTIRLIDRLQTQATADQLRSGIPFNGGLLQFHSGEVDLSHLVGKGVFQLWNDPQAFARVSIGSGGEVRWSDEVDLCADALYLEITGKSPEEVFPNLKKAAAHA